MNHCPFLERLEIAYDEASTGEKDFTHLALLSQLCHVTQLALSDCDFYGHSLFTLLETRGSQLKSLTLERVKELNANALDLMGDVCQSLESLALKNCSFQVDDEEEQAALADMIEEALDESSPKHFLALQSLTLDLADLSTDLEPAKLLLCQCRPHLASLSLSLGSSSLTVDEEAVLHLLVRFASPLPRLERFAVPSPSQLTVHTVNLVVAACPHVREIGNVDAWRGMRADDPKSISLT